MKIAKVDRDLVVWLQKGDNIDQVIESILQSISIREQLKQHGIIIEKG